MTASYQRSPGVRPGVDSGRSAVRRTFGEQAPEQSAYQVFEVHAVHRGRGTHLVPSAHPAGVRSFGEIHQEGPQFRPVEGIDIASVHIHQVSAAGRHPKGAYVPIPIPIRTREGMP